MMKMYDAGTDASGQNIVAYRCPRCSHDAGWITEPPPPHQARSCETSAARAAITLNFP